MNNNYRPVFVLAALLAAGLLAPAVRAGSAGPLVQKIKAVDREGKGNVEAARAWNTGRPEVSPLGAMETRVTSPPPALSTSWRAISTP